MQVKFLGAQSKHLFIVTKAFANQLQLSVLWTLVPSVERVRYYVGSYSR